MTDPHRVGRLDGVRALAALSVVCFHVWLYRFDRPRGERTELLDQVLFHASTGLICFFVLSGFLLYGAFARAALTGSEGVAVVPYLRRRAARIVPAYWVCGALSLVLFAAVGYGAITPAAHELPIFALFLQNYSLATMGELNPVTWTLCVEVAFYALLPLVGWLALRLGPGRVRAQVLLVVGLIAIAAGVERRGPRARLGRRGGSGAARVPRGVRDRHARRGVGAVAPRGRALGRAARPAHDAARSSRPRS